MTLEMHQVELKARDGISPVLRQVATAAGDMGRSMGTATQRFNFDRAAMTGGLRELQGAMSDWSRAAAEEEAGLMRLAQAVENTGASYANLEPRINAMIERGQDLAFADDKVVDSLTRLTTVTGDTESAMQQMGLVMDFARARGIDLTTSADIIGKVYEGNLGILSRYGIALEEGTTATEALAILQQRVAGQASAYSSSAAGDIDRYRNALDNLTESIGAHSGALQTFLALMPGANAAYSVMAGLFTGAGGAKGLAAAAPYLIQGAGLGTLGAIGYGYAKDDVGTTLANDIANKVFLVMSSLINASIPGSPFDEQKYIDQMSKNSTWDQIISRYGSVEAAAAAFGVKGTTTTVEGLTTIAGETVNNPDKVTYTPPTNDEIYAAIVNAAASGNMTVAQLLATPARQANFYGAMGAGLSSPYVGGKPYDVYGGRTPLDVGPYSGKRGMHVDYLAESYGSMAAYGTASYMATPGYEEARRAAEFKQLQGQYGGFAGVIQGVDSRHDVTTAFNTAQGNILQTESVYGSQVSEYTQQMNALTAAYEILQQRQADGIALSKEDQQLLNDYPELYDRVSGGVEDATLAQGHQAAAYIRNMELGDQLNQTMMGNTEATGDLVRIIEDLILAMDGVPAEVRSRIYIDRAEEMRGVLADIASYLNGLDGRSVNFSVNASGNGLSLGRPNGPGITPLLEAHGGLISAAATGRMVTSRYVVVGDGNGPEMVSLPHGSMVWPAGATRAAMNQGGGGITIHNLTVIANDAMEFADSMRAMRYAEARA